jgi:SAM-dependent MidA family methyltransferase
VARRIEFQRQRQAVSPPPADDAGEPRLVELLRAEIDERGPLTFARFMARALYEPGLGYYSTSEERPTRSGDFLTAPELHPIFGHALARQVAEMWQRLGQPAPFVLREYGAGSGALGASIAEGLARLDGGLADVLDYQPLEVAGRALAEPAPGHRRPMIGCVLANEFVDALPVHRVVVRGGQLREIFVGWRDGRFVEVVGTPSTAALSAWFDRERIALAEGQHAEVCLAAAEWLADVAAQLERGYLLVVDYAAEAAALYGEPRFEGTLRAFRGQHTGGDVLAGVGRQDLTATVDLDALVSAAQEAGLHKLGVTSQAEFLIGCGLAEVLEDERARSADDLPATLLLRSAVARLLDSQALGGYRVAVFGRDVAAEPPLSGLGYRLAGG